jgi:nucleoside 2-deoxyribosyltransferase
MKIYVAAIFRKWPDAQELAYQLEDAGHEVTSTWLREVLVHDTANDLHAMTNEQKREIANVDLFDVARADAVVLICEKGDVDGGTRGGRHVETGYAIAHGIPVIAIGGPENVFHYLPGVHNVADVKSALIVLKTVY